MLMLKNDAALLLMQARARGGSARRDANSLKILEDTPPSNSLAIDSQCERAGGFSRRRVSGEVS
jgi:hypothetical protein